MAELLTDNKTVIKSEFKNFHYEASKSEYKWITFNKIRKIKEEVKAGDVAVYDPIKDKILYLNVKSLKGVSPNATGRIFCLPLGVVVSPFYFGDNNVLNSDTCQIFSFLRPSYLYPEYGHEGFISTNYIDVSCLSVSRFFNFNRILPMAIPTFKYRTNSLAQGSNIIQIYSDVSTFNSIVIPYEIDSNYSGATTNCNEDGNACYRSALTDGTSVILPSPYEVETWHDSSYESYLPKGTFISPIRKDAGFSDDYRNNINGQTDWETADTLYFPTNVTQANVSSGMTGILAILVRFLPIEVNKKRVQWGLVTPYLLWCFYSRKKTIETTYEICGYKKPEILFPIAPVVPDNKTMVLYPSFKYGVLPTSLTMISKDSTIASATLYFEEPY